MAVLEINGTFIHSADIVGVEEKLVTVKVQVQVDNPVSKPQKGLFAKLMYSPTIEKTVEMKYTVIEIKVKGGTQITTNIDEDTGAINNRSHQLYDFYAMCGDREFLKAMSCADNKLEVELEIGNYYCYPNVLAYSDYMNTNVIIDVDVESKDDFVNKYINNVSVKKEIHTDKVVRPTLQEAVDAAKSTGAYSESNGEKLVGSVFMCEIATFTKAAGGRATPFFTNFMPKLGFGKSVPQLTGTVILPESIECCYPGDNVSARIKVEKKIRIDKGSRFSIIENGKTIGFGTIIDVAE